MGKVYFITDGVNIKIGFTKLKVETRLKQLQTSNVNKLFVLGYITGTMEDEKRIHKIFGENRIRYNGEWFEPVPNLIEYINTYNEMKNCYVDWLDGKLMPFFSVPII